MTKNEVIELLENRKVYVNGKSAEIQKKLFELGWAWSDTPHDGVDYTEHPFLYIYAGGKITHGENMRYFIENINTEISAEEILAIEVIPEFKENDVVAAGWGKGRLGADWLFVFKDFSDGKYYEKVILMLRGSLGGDLNMRFDDYCDSQEWIRLATEEEKQKLIDALKASSNPKAKDVLKEVFGIENKPTCPFKPFDRVLVRDSNIDIWRAEIFSHYLQEDQPFPTSYLCVGGLWAQCIPYEGNESLLGTSDKTKGKL